MSAERAAASAHRAASREHRRLVQCTDKDPLWKLWGPYVSERQWGTVREDYSPQGTAWEYFPHDHARSRAYRWGEDGLMGLCDHRQLLCCSLALWPRESAQHSNHEIRAGSAVSHHRMQGSGGSASMNCHKLQYNGGGA